MAAETAEIQILSILILSAIILLNQLKLRTNFFFLSRQQQQKQKHNTNLPPGPWSLPVIGSIHCLLGSLPHHALRRLSHRYGPVMFLRLGQIQALVISSPAAAREVMRTHDAAFPSRPLTPTMDVITYGGKGVALSPSYGRRWKELRRICAAELLCPRRVRSFRRVRESEAASLVAPSPPRRRRRS
uniref:Cytochrome P450 n=1 Tax=Leersia perrieri TaxID=77586 RepID=A0A0D9VAH2_9ORYZ